jgi:hypothetical protein
VLSGFRHGYGFVVVHSDLLLSCPGSSALTQFDRAAKEWIGLVAYRLMSKTEALFPRP